MQTEGERKKLQKDLSDCQEKIEQSHTKFYNLKKEVEESPLSVLRQELGSRQLEIGELQSKVKSANEMAEDYKKKFEQVKRDMIQLKRQIDKEKEITLTKQAEELEQLKQMMRVKQAQDEERSQFDSLKQQLAQLKGQLTTKPQTVEAPTKETNGIVSKDKNIYFDDFARQFPSPQKPQQESIQKTITNQKTYSNKDPASCDWERLMRERDEMLNMGLYTKDDPLIRELERQITSSQLKSQSFNQGTY